MVHYSNSSLGGALKSPGKNRPFALTFACHGEKTIAPRKKAAFSYEPFSSHRTASMAPSAAPVLKMFSPSHTYLASSILLDSRYSSGILDGCRFIKHTPWFTTFGATIVDHLNTQTFMPNRIGSFGASRSTIHVGIPNALSEKLHNSLNSHIHLRIHILLR